MAEVDNAAERASEADRRQFLANCGRFAVVTPPAITMLLSTSLTSDAIAGSGASGRIHGNNGPGNGLDPQPPGDPRVNDGPGTEPGSPGNRGGPT
ncbi:MAG TPA: hypothetical protein VKB08_21670 [Bradyrhizobium sp.]|nr:hypothetical protein [Bradyrhizobium sp.]